MNVYDIAQRAITARGYLVLQWPRGGSRGTRVPGIVFWDSGTVAHPFVLICETDQLDKDAEDELTGRKSAGLEMGNVWYRFGTD
jgi:hypothetical protein